MSQVLRRLRIAAERLRNCEISENALADDSAGRYDHGCHEGTTAQERRPDRYDRCPLVM